MSTIEFLYLSQEEVIAAGGLDMAAAMADVEAVLQLHYAGDDLLPPKAVLDWGQGGQGRREDHINAMPAYLGGDYNVAGLKWIASFPANPHQRNLPRASGLIVLNDPDAGVPLAVMDGTVISALRTGAVTGVAARHLARPGSRCAGLIGAGVQNRTQLMALRVALPHLQEAFIYDIRRSRSDAFAREMTDLLDLPVRVADDAETLVRKADVLVTATTTLKPIVRHGWLREGSFYAHISGYECEFAVIAAADKVVVDDWEQVKHRAAQTIAYMHQAGEFGDDDLYAELGEIVAGDKPGRESDAERIFFNPVGLGTEDVAVAARIYRTAQERGLGQPLTLWQSPHWV
jgi:ornithine cyclodeaminase